MVRKTAQVIPFPSDQFDAAWAALTDTMRRRSDGQTKLRQLWAMHAHKIGADKLLAALRRYVAEDKDLGRTGGPGLQTWLRACKYEHWLDTPDTAVAPELALRMSQFHPTRLRESFHARFTDQRARDWLDTCRFNIHDRTIIVETAPRAEWADGPFREWMRSEQIYRWRVG